MYVRLSDPTFPEKNTSKITSDGADCEETYTLWKRDLDCNYTIPIDLGPNTIPFDAKSSKKSDIKIKFLFVISVYTDTDEFEVLFWIFKCSYR